MKKILFCAMALAAASLTVSAQQYVERTNFLSNWSIGVDGGVTTPLRGHAFFGSMKGTAGLHIEKQVSPIFGLGVEGYAAFNTSQWNAPEPRSYTMVDESYVGAYGTVNLTNLFMGFSCEPRKFSIDAVLGAGWGHEYWAASQGEDWNTFVTKAGLNFNYKVCPKLTLSLKPAILWDMSDGGAAQSSCSYNANRAVFNCAVGVTYNFGPGFKCYIPQDNSAEIAALNAQVNALRAANDACAADLAACTAAQAALAADLAACQAQGPKIVKENTNTLQSTRYVFYKNASSVITPDQMPNVEMIAQYLKNHPKATVDIKGYASKTGPEELNIKLANARAESVKNALIKKYGVKADRIQAKGMGIGDSFSEESWNRVSICTLEN